MLLPFGALLMMATSMVFAFVWIPRKLLGRMHGVSHLEVRTLPMLASLAFLAIIAVWRHGAGSTIAVATPSPFSVSIYLLSCFFPILSIAALVIVIRSQRHQINRAVRMHSLCVTISCTGLTVYFAYWGMIGFRFWLCSKAREQTSTVPSSPAINRSHHQRQRWRCLQVIARCGIRSSVSR